MRSILIALLLLGQDPTTVLLDSITREIQQIKALLAAAANSGVVTVATSAQLQAALDGPASVIQVQPGTYRGNFTLKAKPTTTTVRGLGFAGRATPGLAYPVLTALDPLTPVVGTLDGAHDYILSGLEMTGVAPDRDVVIIGPMAMTSLAQVPRNITFSQVYIHGVNGFGHRGIMFNAINGVIVDSYFDQFVEQGRDSQAVATTNGPGPYTYTNNYFEASGENVIFGGSDPGIPNLVPSDITITGNTFFKPSIWKTQYPGSVKNLFELKNARRVTITGNVFENTWADAQSGNGIIFTVRNQDGGCPWCEVSQVTFSCNQVRNVTGFAFNILASDNNHPSKTSTDFTINKNLVTNAGQGLLVGGGMQRLTVTNNILLGIRGSFLVFNPPPNTGFVFTGNQVTSGEYGIMGDGTTGPGTASLALAPGAVFTGNTIETTSSGRIAFPPGNTLAAAGTIARAAATWTCP